MDEEEYNQDVETFGHDEDKDKREEEDHYEKMCYMCRWPESKAGPMISMPDGMNLCHDCMQKTFNSMTKGDTDFSKLPDMPYVSINLNDLNMTPPAVEIPEKQKIKKKAKEQPVLTMKDISTPHIIKVKLDKYVIGQGRAKKVMAVAVYSHCKRVFLDHPSKDVVMEDARTDKSIVIEKSNILMISPTRSGKAYLVRTLARLLDVPLAIADATSLTETGYVGDDIESVVSRLLAAADNSMDWTQKGIIFIDEIDRTAEKKQASTRDVSGESIQQEPPKLLEGSTVEAPVGSNQKNAMTPMVTMNTDNVLFICGGAFPNLEEIIKEHLMRKTTMGFGSILEDTYNKSPDILGQVTSEDLRIFRIVPRFLGRPPVAVTLQGLTEDMMVRILKEPKNAIIKQYERLLEMDEIRLIFKDGALKWIAGEVIKRGTGARALRTILEEFMLGIMYEVPKDPSIGSAIVTHPYLERNGGPLVQVRG